MIEEQGHVVAIDDDFAWVAMTKQSTCKSCSVRSGCGQRVLTQLSNQRAEKLVVSNKLRVGVGDLVAIGIAHNTLLKASFLVYIIPLLLMMLSSVIAHAWFTPDEGKIISMGLLGLLTGLFIVKILSSKLSCNPAYQPQLLRKIR